jgi:aspartate carbamoyltransferase regulatory subunit
VLEVTAIKKGIVIDHIPAGKGLKVFEKLRLDRSQSPAVLLMHVSSGKRGTKDIIKIQDDLTVDLRILGLIDPGITVNYIENEQVIDKKRPPCRKRSAACSAARIPGASAQWTNVPCRNSLWYRMGRSATGAVTVRN